MIATLSDWNGDSEMEFRRNCNINNDDLSILMADRVFTRITARDLRDIIDYGWDSDDVERMINGDNAADDITRLAAWIRECGEIGDEEEDGWPENLYTDRNKPEVGYFLDEDGNYPEEGF